MKRRTYEDYKAEIMKAFTNPEPKTCDYWHKPANMRAEEQVDYFFRYHRIPTDKTIKILNEIKEA